MVGLLNKMSFTKQDIDPESYVAVADFFECFAEYPIPTR